MAKEKEPYKIEPNNWFQAKPYGFAFYDRSSGANKPAKRTVWLPISPQNLQINTPMATNIITTLYGIVEEHSEIRYYDITISGTTGISPKYIGYKTVDDVNDKIKIQSEDPKKNQLSAGRASFDLGSKTPIVGAFIDSITDLAVATPTNQSGVDANQTGYYAFHKLYQFFLLYKEDTASTKPNSTKQANARKRHPLTFLNYKDNTQYDCVPVIFNLVRSASDPMLYNYTIQLRAYNLKTIAIDKEALSFLDDAAKLGLFNGSGTATDKDKFADIADIAGAVGSFLGGL